MRGVREEAEEATLLWMAAKFAWVRAGKSQACKSVGRRQFTVLFNHWNYPEINLANGFFQFIALNIERG